MNCKCNDTIITEQTIFGGSTRYVNQCVNCGRAVGGAIKKSSVKGQPPQFDFELRNSRQEDREEQYLISQQKRDAEREIRGEAWWEYYRQYMASPMWREKRQQVLERDSFRCKGCEKERATEVHHKTYARLGNELLIDLISLCSECHARIHEEETQ
jgi:5-methylcytosine-specific restriction endonuclease McrA